MLYIYLLCTTTFILLWIHPPLDLQTAWTGQLGPLVQRRHVREVRGHDVPVPVIEGVPVGRVELAIAAVVRVFVPVVVVEVVRVVLVHRGVHQGVAGGQLGSVHGAVSVNGETVVHVPEVEAG